MPKSRVCIRRQRLDSSELPVSLLVLNIALCVIAAQTARVAAQSPATSSSLISLDEAGIRFREQIAPILQTHCVRCHGSEKQEGQLNLSDRELARRGGDRGVAIVPGHPDQGSFLAAIRGTDPELTMPPEGERLAEADILALEQWIQTGAAWPDELNPLPQPARVESTRDASALDGWAFRPLKTASPPSDPSDRWSRGPIDQWIYAQAQSQHQTLQPAADRRTLARRLYFDLIGRPPTWHEIESFVSDTQPQAYERLVDRLLDRPEYGERAARGWLDLVRYAESDGFKADVYRPHAWRYRDYVVRSLNADKPYDRFIHEQLAGDELFPEDPDARIATGYLRLWPLEDNQKDVERQWTLVLQDVTEVTGEAMLGLGLRCARCHDHKYDPITQRDYYGFQAYFAAMLPRDDQTIPASRLSAAWQQSEHTIEPLRRAMRRMEHELVATKKKTIQAYPPYLQAMYAKPVSDWSPLDFQYAYLARPQVEQKSTKELTFPPEMQARWESLQREFRERTQDSSAIAAPVMTMTDVGTVAPTTHLNNDRSRDVVEPAVPHALHSDTSSMGEIVPTPSTTGRRAALARWLTNPQHPLTARVIVNRLWQQHFGRGIVSTPNDFGKQGTPPTHPELLDWLALRFMEQGWSWKAIHRDIVCSATYRQAVRPIDPSDTEGAERCFNGRLPQRLSGEQLRDAILMMSGEIRSYQPAPGADGMQEPVPSIQVANIRNRPDEWINAFDGPDMFNSCARRYTSTTALQSLLVVNSEWTLQRSQKIAERIVCELGEQPTRESQMVAAFRTLLARDPSADEIQAALGLWSNSPAAESDRTPLVDLCHVLLCSNEFLYVD